MRGASLPLYGLTTFSLLDFPGVPSCVVWVAGCNMRCGYCHNPEIVTAKGNMPLEELWQFLENRKGKLEGVVFSGGEATGRPDLPDLAGRVRAMGYKVKLDTNGTRPEMVKELCEKGLLDYLALDFKAPEAKFHAVSGSKQYGKFLKTLRYLCAEKPVNFEVRTTVHTGLMDEVDVAAIMETLTECGYNGTYFVQNYQEAPNIGNLPPQTRPLDPAALPAPRGFTLETRNF